MQRQDLEFARGRYSHLYAPNNDPSLERRVPSHLSPQEQRQEFDSLTHFPYASDYYHHDIGGPQHVRRAKQPDDILHMFNRVSNDPETRFAVSQGHQADSATVPFDYAAANGHIGGVGYYGAALPLGFQPHINGNKIVDYSRVRNFAYAPSTFFGQHK